MRTLPFTVIGALVFMLGCMEAPTEVADVDNIDADATPRLVVDEDDPGAEPGVFRPNWDPDITPIRKRNGYNSGGGCPRGPHYHWVRIPNSPVLRRVSCGGVNPYDDNAIDGGRKP